MARRSGLGRGLEALIPPPTGGNDGQGGAFREIPIGSIRANTRQPRQVFDESALDSLTESVKVSGVLQPILVREISPGSFELIAGERRWRAATNAGLTTIPAVIRSVDEIRSLEDALVENLHREDLGPIEEALAYQRLQDEFGLTQDQVAKRVGKSRSAVANSIRLLQLPASIQESLSSGRLSAGHARALLGLGDSTRQEELAVLAAAEGMNVRDLEERIRRLNNESQEHNAEGVRKDDDRGPLRETPVRAAGLLELEELLSEHLDTRVTITMSSKNRGRVVVDFSSADDLDRIFRVITVGREPSV